MIHALHGNFGLPGDWEAALPSGIPVHCWNLWEIRRHHPEAATLPGFAAWLNHQSAPVPAAPAAPASRILLGYSLGARLALHTLTTAPPGIWQAAILLAPHPGLPDPADRSARLIHDQIWASRTRLTPWPELLDDWNAQPVLAGGPPPSAPESWRPEIAAAFEDWSLGHQPSMLPALAEINLPILWITGARDLKFTALAARTTALSPHIRHHILPARGHRLLHEAPGEIRRLISSFLQDPPRSNPARPAAQFPPASA